MYLHEIKKSKFIAISFNVNSKQDVKNKLITLKEKYKDARHFCYAYIIDNGREAGSHDDGEPSGTAGKPILRTMQLTQTNNKVVFVIRYFGGKKLGASGLIRAYVFATKNELKNSSSN